MAYAPSTAPDLNAVAVSASFTLLRPKNYRRQCDSLLRHICPVRSSWRKMEAPFTSGAAYGSPGRGTMVHSAFAWQTAPGNILNESHGEAYEGMSGQNACWTSGWAAVRRYQRGRANYSPRGVPNLLADERGCFSTKVPTSRNDPLLFVSKAGYPHWILPMMFAVLKDRVTIPPRNGQGTQKRLDPGNFGATETSKSGSSTCH